MMHDSFRKRLLWGMLAASLIPVLLCSILMVEITRLQMDQKNHEDAAEQSQAILMSMDEVSAGMENAVASLQSSPIVCRALLQGQADLYPVNSLLFSVTEAPRSFADFFLYDNSGNCLYSTLRTSPAESLSTSWGILHRAKAAGGAPAYDACEEVTDLNAPLFQAAALIRTSDGRPAGFLLMRMYASGFRTLFSGKYPQNNVMVLSPYFHPVYSSQSYLNQTAVPLLRQQFLSDGTLQDETNINTLFRHAPTGLFLVLRQPRMFTAGTVQRLYTAGILCGLICVAISVLLSLPMSRRISRPVSRLQKAFGKVRQDDLDTRVTVEGNDELAQLGEQFNDMVSALKANREQLLRNRQELDEAQIRMLQAQLNPHFLCNTLDTIKWISKLSNVPQVALMSTDLADILRFCISADEFVPLYQEVEILHRYVEIQRIRLSDGFQFLTEIDEELYDCFVPKMILQPIVENAILHGLEGVSDGRITLKAEFETGHSFRIVITDNGKGFPEEMKGRPYGRDPSTARGHLGLYNADTILRRSFGEEWGLTLGNGADGVGACVTVRLPVKEELPCEKC